MSPRRRWPAAGSSARCGSPDRAGCSTCAARRRLRRQPPEPCCCGCSIPAAPRPSAPTLARRLQQTEGALDSLTHLIESAPFPMWYRGPDLSLGLVNSAFVAAVEGGNAADVIARGSELIEGAGDDNARAGAMVALETDQALFAHPAGDDRRRAADAAPGRRAAGDRSGGGVRDRHPGSRGRALRACPQHPVAARAGRPHVGRRGAVRRRSPPDLLQPAVRDHGPDRPRMACRKARVRPPARTHARE